MPPTKRIVCYTGAGARASGIHSDAAFLKAVRKLHCSKDCPQDVDGWIKWSGALRDSPARCARMVKSNARIDAAARSLAAASRRFDACVAKECGGPSLQGAAAQCGAVKCAKQSSSLAKSDVKYRRLARM